MMPLWWQAIFALTAQAISVLQSLSLLMSGVWLTALAVAVLGTQTAVAFGIIGFDDHRFMASELPVLAIVVGGALFGAGMVLTRGCVSRLTVLSGSGNLRAALVIVIFAIVAHATLKGILPPAM